MGKKCEDCGRFMRLTDRMPQDDEFDSELAIECGYDENGDSPYDMKWRGFAYVQAQWECTTCDTIEWHTEGKKYYFNPESGNYDGEKPLTPKDKLRIERETQEAAGQQRLL